MASTYTTRTRLEKQGSGENDDSWGTKLNTLFDLVDEAMDGYLAKSVAGASNVTLSSTNGASDESRQKTLKFTGTLTGSIDVIVPAVEKFYGVWNATAGSFVLTFKPSVPHAPDTSTQLGQPPGGSEKPCTSPGAILLWTNYRMWRDVRSFTRGLRSQAMRMQRLTLSARDRSRERLRVGATSALFLAANFTSAAIAEPTQGPIPIEIMDSLFEYSDVVRDFTDRSQLGGMLPSAVRFPALGRLLRVGGNGELSSCSGGLVSPIHFLTAAHCVCERPHADSVFDSGKDCIEAEAPDSRKGYVFLPATGLVVEVQSVQINPHFRLAVKASYTTDVNESADLAVLTLSQPIDVEYLPIADATDEFSRYVSAGFGQFGVSKQGSRVTGLPPQVTFVPGIGSLAAYWPRFSPSGCSDVFAGADDMVCATFSADNADGQYRDAAGCPGDSGSLLIGVNEGGATAAVVGVASVIEDSATTSSCAAESQRHSGYVLTGLHRSWLDPILAGAPKITARRRDCIEGYLPVYESLRLTFTTFHMKETAIVAVWTKIDGGGAIRSAPKLTSQGKPCPHMTPFAATSCLARTSERIEVELEPGAEGEPLLVQISACVTEPNPMKE
jgi:hypothetical protein